MIKIEFDHWKLVEIAKKHPVLYESLRAIDGSLGPLEEAKENKGYYQFSNYINRLEDLPEELFEMATFKPVKPMKLLTPNGGIDPKAIKEALATQQVHLPGNELMRVAEATVREDCCTDELNKLLTEGWRIIAVCPQASRRPDYVLGRSMF